jgi:flagellar biosynthesis anti-sigma factor FlgM
MKVHSNAIDAYARTALNSTSPAKPIEPTGTPGVPSTSEAAQVTVSDEARALAARGASSFDDKKVQALKKQIADGEYQINPQKIAGRILDSIG